MGTKGHMVAATAGVYGRKFINPVMPENVSQTVVACEQCYCSFVSLKLYCAAPIRGYYSPKGVRGWLYMLHKPIIQRTEITYI